MNNETLDKVMREISAARDALAAENARLRGEVERLTEQTKRAKQLRADDLANLASVHAALFRALGLAGCGANTPPLDCIRMLVDRHTADLARVTAERDVANADREVLENDHMGRAEHVMQMQEIINRLTSDLARVSAERDVLQGALDVAKDTAARFMTNEQLVAFLAALRIAACAPASGEGGYPYAPCPKCGQQAAHDGPVCAGCFTKLSLAKGD
jgi:hypothetical protein